MKRSGTADLPLHHGRVPPWLAQRMSAMGGAIVEALVVEYGRAEVLRRLSDPHWFQALGCVLGMDWHSSGITTSVLGALKKAINPMAHELGLYICGGRGRHSRQTPQELLELADKTGLDGETLVRCSKLSAKVDNTAIQDGYQLYLHSFIVSQEGDWSVIQQGMNDGNGMARRYHWHSPTLRSFTEEPHTAVCGPNQGLILNLTHKAAAPTKDRILSLTQEGPERLLPEIQKLVLPRHHDVKPKDVDMKRLGSVVALAYERQTDTFDNLLLTQGLGPRTLQSLTLVSEVIYGTPSRFTDPARFAFAHGGKDGHPFPVPTKVYDEAIGQLKQAVHQAKIGRTDKLKAMQQLSGLSRKLEQGFTPEPGSFQKLVAKERRDSWKHGGRTVLGKAKKPASGGQLPLF